MPSLKELRSRKKSVQATQKITAAMKMIAAAKLRRAQEQAEAARPYATYMSNMLKTLQTDIPASAQAPLLIHPRRPLKTHLIIVASANRGLCGGFNSLIVRHVRRLLQEDQTQQRKSLLLCVGRKGFEALRRDYSDRILEVVNAYDKPLFVHAQHIATKVLDVFFADPTTAGAIDGCTLVYNKFISALTQQVTHHSLIPYSPLADSTVADSFPPTTPKSKAPYIYEPTAAVVLEELLKQNLSIQIFRALLENTASEQGARMAAMDGATRNAEEMIQALNLRYNRTRQAFITKELIEIISGAEAL